MIESNTISLNYIKKEQLTGSYQGMRYRLAKDGEEILVAIWPEPYNYVKTKEEVKQFKKFPLTPEGKEEAVSWLNEQYEALNKLWKSAK